MDLARLEFAGDDTPVADSVRTLLLLFAGREAQLFDAVLARYKGQDPTPDDLSWLAETASDSGPSYIIKRFASVKPTDGGDDGADDGEAEGDASGGGDRGTDRAQTAANPSEETSFFCGAHYGSGSFDTAGSPTSGSPRHRGSSASRRRSSSAARTPLRSFCQWLRSFLRSHYQVSLADVAELLERLSDKLSWLGRQLGAPRSTSVAPAWQRTLCSGFDSIDSAVLCCAAVFLYSVSIPLPIFAVLNTALRENDAVVLARLAPLRQWLDRFFFRMPTAPSICYRGQTFRSVHFYSDAWPNFRLQQLFSCSLSATVAKDQFLEGNQAGTLFVVACVSAVDIAPFSEYAAEQEVLLPYSVPMETLYKVPLSHMTTVDQNYDVVVLRECTGEKRARSLAERQSAGAGDNSPEQSPAPTSAIPRRTAYDPHIAAADPTAAQELALALRLLRAMALAYSEITTAYVEPHVLVAPDDAASSASVTGNDDTRAGAAETTDSPRLFSCIERLICPLSGAAQSDAAAGPATPPPPPCRR